MPRVAFCSGKQHPSGTENYRDLHRALIRRASSGSSGGHLLSWPGEWRASERLGARASAIGAAPIVERARRDPSWRLHTTEASRASAGMVVGQSDLAKGEPRYPAALPTARAAGRHTGTSGTARAITPAPRIASGAHTRDESRVAEQDAGSGTATGAVSAFEPALQACAERRLRPQALRLRENARAGEEGHAAATHGPGPARQRPAGWTDLLRRADAERWRVYPGVYYHSPAASQS